MQGKPQKPPNSAYSLFSRVMLKNPELRKNYDTPKARMQEIAKLWKALPKVDKNMYAEEVKRLIDSYKMEYATYLDSLSEEQREEELANNLPKRKAKAESSKPTKKMKQMTIKDLNNTYSENSETEQAKEFESSDVFSREPPQPPAELFELFKKDFIQSGKGNEKKAKMTWVDLSEEEKQKYKLKLEELKQQFFIDYRAFLTSLSPEELKLYSTYKVNNNKNQTEERASSGSDSESSSSESSSEEVSDDEDAQVAITKKKGTIENKEDSSNSSSSSSSDDSDSD